MLPKEFSKQRNNPSLGPRVHAASTAKPASSPKLTQRRDCVRNTFLPLARPSITPARAHDSRARGLAQGIMLARPDPPRLLWDSGTEPWHSPLRPAEIALDSPARPAMRGASPHSNKTTRVTTRVTTGYGSYPLLPRYYPGSNLARGSNYHEGGSYPRG